MGSSSVSFGGQSLVLQKHVDVETNIRLVEEWFCCNNQFFLINHNDAESLYVWFKLHFFYVVKLFKTSIARFIQKSFL